MTTHSWTAPKAAIRLSKLVDAYCSAHSVQRFPVNVGRLALGAAEIFGWKDPISKVEAASIPGFEGCLSPNADRTKWLLLYNDQLPSVGRIRFTQAHELGHYILHRMHREAIQCSEFDMLNWSRDEANSEAQADHFASYLLMPLNDYREQVSSFVDLDTFSHCADRYGVSLTAAILKWLDYTDEKAVVVTSIDGYIKWAWSSEPAFKVGAYFKTSNQTIPLPAGSIAANGGVRNDRTGTTISARIWFPHVDDGAPLREMKLVTQYGSTLSLLCMPRTVVAWPPRKSDEE